jgi:TrmH family RNA methyltransferase
MLSAAQKRFIRALHRKAERQERRLFLVEGPTLAREALDAGWAFERVVATSEWIAPEPGFPANNGAGPTSGRFPGRSRPGSNSPICAVFPASPVVGIPQSLASVCVKVSQDELCAVSAMDAPNQVLAVVRMPEDTPPPPQPAGLALCLDGVHDPGNLGTILRSAAWFGVERVVCSPDCVERFNPKVVQASMGAIFRVPVHATDIAGYLRGLPSDTVVAGAVLDGENVYTVETSEPAVLVLGNEARGLSDAVRAQIRKPVTIPRLGTGESLNVAMAATVLCSVWKEKTLRKR